MHCFRTASLVCAIALCGCGVDHPGRQTGKITSISDFRVQTTGTWCFLDKGSGRVMKMEISPAGHYLLDYLPVNSDSSATWVPLNRGTVGYGKGRFADDGSKYYFAHLSGTAINFSITAGTPVATLIAQGIPVLVQHESKQGSELQAQYIIRDCSLNQIRSGLNPSGHP